MGARILTSILASLALTTAALPGRNDPQWSDAQGWSDATNYETIQAVGTSGALFLLARANRGMITLRYDRSDDSWDAVASNDPGWSDAQGWADPTNYRTIQAVGVGNDLYLLARANRGILTLRYNPATDRWDQVASNDPPWSDALGWADLSNYSTIQAVAAGNDLYLLARANAGMITLRYDRSTDRWINVAKNDPNWSDSLGWADASNYRTIQAVGVGGDLYLLARANRGMITLRYDRATDHWVAVARNDPEWSDRQGWADFSNYSTIQAVGVGGELYLLARANRRMITLRYDRGRDVWVPAATNDPIWSDAQGWGDFTNYSTIQAVEADGLLYLLARANKGMITLRYDRGASRWINVAANDPAWSDSQGWNDISNYATIQATGGGGELYLLARANRGMISLRYDPGRDRWVTPPQIARRPISVVRHTTASLTNTEVDALLADGSEVLQTDDGANDVACNVAIVRQGVVGTFAAGDGDIRSQAELTQVFNVPGNVKVVDSVDFCAGRFQSSFIGCGLTPGNSFIVERFTADQEGILWIHEFGHNQGLPHRDDSSDNVMFPSIGTNRRRVTQAECNAFIGSGGATAEVAALADAEALDLEGFGLSSAATVAEMEGGGPDEPGIQVADVTDADMMRDDGPDPMMSDAPESGSGDGAMGAETDPMMAAEPPIVIAEAEEAADEATTLSVVDFVRQIYFEGLPLDVAATYGEGAVPALLEILRDPEEVEFHENAALTLGMIGSEAAVEPLIGYLDAALSEPLTDREAPEGRFRYNGAVGATIALGYLANLAGSETAVERLIEQATGALTATESAADQPAEAQSDLAEYAVIALGFSGAESALERLETRMRELPTTEGAPAAAGDDILDTARSILEQVSDEGLVGYYSDE